MRWSLGLGRIAGIKVYVHFTTFILLAWIALGQGIRTGRWEAAVGGLILLISLMAIIVLHELGHALAARRYGIRTRDITLLPIGGVARLERMPEKPLQELVVALAGPAVNVVLAALLLVVLLGLRGGPVALLDQLVTDPGLLDQLLLINIFLVLFNMLPAFPMDGGRVLRAMLALSMDYVTATRVAATVGQGMAVLFALGGLLIPGAFMLLLIALFVWVGAEEEAGMVRTKAVLAGVPVARLMATHFHTLHPAEPIHHAGSLVARGFQHDFPVVDNGELVGMLTRQDLLSALASQLPEAPVEDVMHSNFDELHPRDTIETALTMFQRCECRALPVLDRGRLIGILTLDRIGEYLTLHDQLPRHQPRPHTEDEPAYRLAPRARRTDDSRIETRDR